MGSNVSKGNNKSGQKATRQLKARWAVILALVVCLIVIVGVLAFQSISRGTTATTLRDSDTAFNVSTLVGKPASSFTAIGVDGKPYTVKPGDGRTKAIVFYMGFR